MNFRDDSKSTSGASPSLAHGEKILVVDEHEPLREVASAILQRYGYCALTVMGGAAAKRHAREHPDVSLLLTDLTLADMSGEDLAGWFRMNRPQVPIVFMSSDPFGLDALRTCRAIEKPFIHIDVLIKTIREALDHGNALMTPIQAAA